MRSKKLNSHLALLPILTKIVSGVSVHKNVIATHVVVPSLLTTLTQTAGRLFVICTVIGYATKVGGTNKLMNLL